LSSLVTTLYTENAIFLIVTWPLEGDRKEIIGLEGFPNVHYMILDKEYWKIEEGEYFRQLEATILGLLRLLSISNWNHVINLSQYDFPIRTNEEIEKIISKTASKNFVVGAKLESGSSSYNKIIGPINECISKSRTKISFLENIWVGSPWYILRRDFVEHLFSSKDTLYLLGALQFVVEPQRIFIPTALANSPFYNSMEGRDLHYVARGRNNMKLWEKDIPSFEKMDQLFVRKVYTTSLQNAIITWIQSRD
jgi:hypothetical protein